jgi:hypothetical protein
MLKVFDLDILTTLVEVFRISDNRQVILNGHSINVY